MVTFYRRRKLRKAESIEAWVIKRWIAVFVGCMLFYGVLIYLLF